MNAYNRHYNTNRNFRRANLTWPPRMPIGTPSNDMQTPFRIGGAIVYHTDGTIKNFCYHTDGTIKNFCWEKFSEKFSTQSIGSSE